MTVYVAEWTSAQNGSAAFDKVGLAPGSLAVKIVKIVVLSSTAVDVARYSSSSITGGTVLTPTPMRDGAGSPTATVKYNATSFSGTPTYFVQNNEGWDGAPSTSVPNTYTPQASLIVKSGAVFVVKNTVTPANIAYMAIYFDEQRLQGGT